MEESGGFDGACHKQVDSGAVQLVEYGEDDGPKHEDRGEPEYDSRQTGRNEFAGVV
jgi:hypothetical protein